jgi:ATP-binding cassette subfamily B (MDR/TAP) protein 1
MERWYELDLEKRLNLPKSVIKDEKAKKAEEEQPEVLDRPKTPIPLGGSILVGGHNLDSLELKWWRSQIGLVQQEPFIFNDTIFRNVEYGLIGSKWEHEDDETKKSLVEDACKEAFADEFITRLPLVCIP